MTKPRKKVNKPLPEAVAQWREALSDERTTHLIKIAFRRTSRALQLHLSEYSVSYSNWTLLRILWQGDGLTQRSLSERAGVSEPSTFTALKAMENSGYVTRQKMAHNSKENRVFLTPKGAALRPAIVSAAEEVNRVALAGVSVEDALTTRRTLLAMIENLDANQMALAVSDEQ